MIRAIRLVRLLPSFSGTVINPSDLSIFRSLISNGIAMSMINNNRSRPCITVIWIEASVKYQSGTTAVNHAHDHPIIMIFPHPRSRNLRPPDKKGMTYVKAIIPPGANHKRNDRLNNGINSHKESNIHKAEYTLMWNRYFRMIVNRSEFLTWADLFRPMTLCIVYSAAVADPMSNMY